MSGDLAIYQKIYPPQEYLTFDGGIDTKFQKALLPENESPDCLNVEFISAAVGTRQGGVKLNTTAAGTNAFDGLYTRRASDGVTEQMLAFIDGHMKLLNTTTFVTVASAQSVFTIGQRVGADLAENCIFIGNGGAGVTSFTVSGVNYTNYGYKYDGTYFTLHGVIAPTQTMTAASQTTGSLTTNGVYKYAYTNVNSALVESNLSPVTQFTISGSALGVVLSNIASGSTASIGVSARRIYRTLAGGSSFFRVATLSDVSTTSYTDTTADSSLGSPAPTDNGVPPAYNAIIYVSNILFCNDVNNPNYVWYSVIGQPYTFPSTNFFKVGDKTSDLVKGFAGYDNYVVIFCESSTFINYMPNPADATTWRQIRLNSPFGSKSPYCVLKCNVQNQDMLLHAATLQRQFMGFAAITGATLDPGVSLQPVTAAGSDLQSQQIEPDMLQVQSAYLGNISGIVYKNRAFISLTYGSGATTNNRIYVWDFSWTNLRKQQLASWVPWTGTPMNIAQFCIYGGKLYGASSGNNGFVYQLGDTGVYNDDGAAINSYWWSKEYPGFEEDTSFTKDFRYLNILYDNAGAYYMNLLFRTDSDLGSGNPITINLTSGATVWGSTMIWGTSTWGGGVSQTDGRIFLGGIRGKRLQFRFDNQNTINQRFRVMRGNFAYNIRGYR